MGSVCKFANVMPSRKLKEMNVDAVMSPVRRSARLAVSSNNKTSNSKIDTLCVNSIDEIDDNVNFGVMDNAALSAAQKQKNVVASMRMY